MTDFGSFGSEKTHNVLKNFKDILTNKVEEVSLEEILKKICVSQPYFAFKKIFKFEDVLIAPIQSEQAIEFEITPMPSAEAGRHLAILGSCCMAMLENEKKFYLASKALKRTVNGPEIISDKSKQLYVIAVAKSLDRVECFSYTALVNEEGEIIFEMDVAFQKLPTKLFNRIFKEHLKPTNKIDFNPYAQNLVRLENTVENNFVVQAELPVIKDEYCAGHFDGAPMLPVGTMSYIITNCIGELLKKIDNTTKHQYYLRDADLRLFEPSNIRNKEFVEIRHLATEGDIHKLSWEVRSEAGNLRNTMQLSFAKRNES